MCLFEPSLLILLLKPEVGLSCFFYVITFMIYGMKYRRKKKEQNVETFKKQLTLKQQKALNATTENIGWA